jgi:hypothetical protein
MSYGFTGAGGSSFLLYLFVDDPFGDGGSQTLQATTSNLVPYQNDGRVFIGSVQGTHATSGSSTGGNGGGGGGFCVAAYSWVQTKRGVIQAKEVTDEDEVLVLTEDMIGTEWVTVEKSFTMPENGVRLTTASGYQLDCSQCTPITLKDGGCVLAGASDGVDVPILRDGLVVWEKVSTKFVGMMEVQKISCHQRVYAAGNRPDQMIFTHNQLNKP